jgi:hypothetical protein
LEAIVVSALWLLLQLIVDVIVTGPIVGYGIFIKPSFLMGYFIIVVAMFLFHKKRHIHIRKQLREGK